MVLDGLWFSNARVSVANEQQKSTGIPLPTLIEASITSAGGFSLLKLYTLLRGKMLSNFIAYQAFPTDIPDSQQVTLRLMSDAYISPNAVETLSFGSGLLGTQFTIAQQADIANQMGALLTGLNFESAISMLDAGTAYIGTNATAASLNSPNQTVVGLKNIPGIDCLWIVDQVTLPKNFKNYAT
ncbi:MAG: hypothetical protein M1839_004477 [Geoglossum umbratile]|nr:MAG: hypothetical protein M1839_004477 [Geoglossum umbratile]